MSREKKETPYFGKGGNMRPEDSILISTRKSLDLGEESTDFDDSIMMHINAAIGILRQVGCGKKLVVVDETQTWSDFLNQPTNEREEDAYNLVPNYIHLRTKILFDPPPPSNVQYYNMYIDEALWRIKTMYEDLSILKEE